MNHNRMAPLRLKAMTLRGIGSYLHGTRLEIRPLTLLCGPNGSGKSTWIKTLAMLRAAAANGQLPFNWKTEEVSANFAHTNAYLAQDYRENPGASSEGSEEDFGPPGTVGLVFDAPTGLQLSPEPIGSGASLPASELLAFLETGECAAGAQFEVFLSNGRRELGDQWGFQRGLELRLGGERLKFVVNPTMGAEGAGCEVFLTRREAEAGVADGGQSFFTGRLLISRELEILDICTADNHARLRVCRTAMRRATQLLAHLLAGFFHLGAIRQIETESNAPELEARASENLRYVGMNGEDTHVLRGLYRINPMIQPQPPYSGAITCQYTGQRTAMRIWRVFYCRQTDEAKACIEHLWNLLPESQRQEWRNFNSAHTDEFSRWNTGDGSSASEDFRRAVEAINCSLLNHLLTRRDLYRQELWPAPGVEAEFYMAQGLEKLVPQDLARLNRVLLDQALRFPQPYDYLTRGDGAAHTGFIFDLFVSRWLRKISDVGTSLVYDRCDAGELWRADAEEPAGYLLSDRPMPVKTRDGEDDAGDFERYYGPTFNGIDLPASPVKLSSGFHQILPIIVQAGLMKQYEICAVENPEVHLHPDSQVKIAEFLVRQAAMGKFMLVETHSDLVVMRAMRAILEETIPEGFVQIAFTHLATQDGLCSSKLESIRIDSRGRIANWPPGFMDTATRESQLMVDLLYGKEADDGE